MALMLVKGDGGGVDVEWSQKQTGTQSNPVLPETHYAAPSDSGRFPGTGTRTPVMSLTCVVLGLVKNLIMF